MMLKLTNINKYYFKNKSNQIHVLNNINLSFNDTGLYFLLGPSGSGKSTLLNVIGLLDSFDSGNIAIEDKTINKYKNIDNIRNHYFGYVFQNYLLNEEQTVYQNLEIVLKLINYQGDFNNRIKNALKPLGMEKYIKRKVKDLSGGQKQRIGIARCLIKSPKIILLDEPTGNLDEKNSVQVMDIIASLSKKCLVIMVSHDQNLASSYADYIINLKDGKVISEDVNTQKTNYNVNDFNTIYLKDYQNNSFENINIYHNEKLPSLTLVFDHNKLYIKCDENINIDIINSQSSIKLLNEHHTVKKEEQHTFDFNLEELDYQKSSKQVLKFTDLFKKAFKAKPKRLLKLAFFITAFIFASSIPYISSLNDIDYREGLETNSHIYEPSISLDAKQVGEVLLEGDLIYQSYSSHNLTYLAPSKNIVTNVDKIYLNASYVPKNDSLNIINGNASNNYTDIYIDKLVANRLLNRPDIKSLGITNINDFLNQEIYFNYFNIKGKISAICDNNEPSIYVNKEMLMLDTKQTSIDNSFLFTSEIKSLENNQYLINEKYQDLATDTNYQIVGTFKSNYDDLLYVSNNNTYLDYYYQNIGSYYLYCNDIEHYTTKLNVNFTNYYQLEKEEYYFKHNASIISSLVFSGITLIISLVFLYFIMASSLIHRIREVGIYRNIGVLRFDLYKMFVSEILSIVIKYSLPGFLTSVIILKYLHNGGLISNYNLIFVPTLLLIYIVLALLIGLIPIYRLTRKTPAEINKKYDI